MLARVGLKTKEQRSWALYDWGNSAFPTIMMTAVLPIYYADVLADGLDDHIKTAYWGYTSAIAMAIIAFIGPFVGALGDIVGRKKPFVLAGTLLGMVFSGLLAMLSGGDWVLGSCFFILGNIGFAFAEIAYNSLLPHIASQEEVNRVSTAGYAIGYFGGGICLCICLAMIQAPSFFGFANASEGVRASFLCVAAWWGVFTVPLLRNIKEPYERVEKKPFSFLSPLKKNIETLKKLRQHKNVFLFLLAFWAYSDGIGTVIKMATVYGKEVGIGTSDLIGAIVMVQFAGVFFTFGFGKIADFLGQKKTLCLALSIYSVICVLAYYMTEGWQFWILGFLLSMVQGGAQAISRSLFSNIIPKEHAGEFFGFYSVSSRFAGIFGPLIFGFFSQVMGSSRHSILAIVVLFVIGMAILLKVDTKEGGKAAA